MASPTPSAVSTAEAGEVLECHLDLDYGDHPKQKLDYFPAPINAAPTLAFIHGGYWQALDKSDFRYLAPPWIERGVSFAAFDPHSQPQYVNQWSLSLQKALPGNTVVELGYQGARGYHLQRAHLINNAPPGPGPINPRRPYKTLSFVPGTLIPSGVAVVSDVSPVSAINLLEDSARSWYDAGWVDVRRRYQHGLTLLSNFTWAKSLTNSPDFRSPMDESAIPQNNSLLDAEKGLACDLRRRFVASLVYELPGWKTRPAFARLTSNRRQSIGHTQALRFAFLRASR